MNRAVRFADHLKELKMQFQRDMVGRYKADYVKFLTYSIASCDETTNHILTIRALYPDLTGFDELETEYDRLGKKINNYLQYVESSWKT